MFIYLTKIAIYVPQNEYQLQKKVKKCQSEIKYQRISINLLNLSFKGEKMNFIKMPVLQTPKNAIKKIQKAKRYNKGQTTINIRPLS